MGGIFILILLLNFKNFHVRGRGSHTLTHFFFKRDLLGRAIKRWFVTQSHNNFNMLSTSNFDLGQASHAQPLNPLYIHSKKL